MTRRIKKAALVLGLMASVCFLTYVSQVVHAGASGNKVVFGNSAFVQSSTLTVTSTADAGDGVCDAVCTLREAITAANSQAGAVTIQFAIPSSDPGCNPMTGVCTIRPETNLPDVTVAATIDGYTQTGASANTNALDQPTNAVLKIELDGSLITPPTNAVGLSLHAPGSLVRGLVINRFNGLFSMGVFVMGQSCSFSCQPVTSAVEGCFIGTDPSGTVALGNSDGVHLARGGVVGGSTPQARNIISGNTSAGVYVESSSVHEWVQGNWIGLSATGAAMGNAGYGVNAPNNIGQMVIGLAQDGSGLGNRIAFNGLGVNVSNSFTRRVRISGNSIYSNSGLGIDLGGDGFTPNDTDDADSGPNTLQNFPDLIRAMSSGNTLTLRYSVSSTTTNSVYPLRVEFFIADADGQEGQTFIGADTYASSSAHIPKDVTFTTPTPLSDGTRIVATATTSDDTGDTSEFSPSIMVGGTPLVVTKTADTDDGVCDADCSLREAITTANANADQNAIRFNIPLSDLGCNSTTGVCTIRPTTDLPIFNSIIFLDGYTQAGATPNTNPLDQPSNAVLKIELDGSLIPSDGTGISINGAGGAGSIVRGLAINSFNLVGVLPNGVLVPTRLLSTVEGCYIGTDATGTVARGNRYGIAPGFVSLVGGSTPQARNIISGNTSIGVGQAATMRVSIVQGNWIGLSATGAAMGNTSDGVYLNGGSNVIGLAQDGSGLGNRIAFNGGVGVNVATSLGNNRINGNSIYSNNGLGIDLGANGITANDTGDADTGSNNLQNFPFITSSGPEISGVLDSAPSTTFRIEFYSNPSSDVDPTGFGEGKTYLGAISVTTDSGGHASFNGVRFQTRVAQGDYITATATDPNGNTSEFAQNRLVSSPTAAPGAISGQVTTADGAPLAGVVLRLGGAGSARAITNSSGQYRFDGLEAGGFYIVTPQRANYSFGPQELSFSLTGNKTDAVFTATPLSTTVANPLDTSEFFVRQHYLDFLGREPDAGGLEYWSLQFDRCNGDAACLNGARINVSAAYFMSVEFQDTGSFVYRLYKGALGRKPGYSEFSQDRQQVIGGNNLDGAKAAFADSFVQRAEFAQKYQSATTAESFVNALIQTIHQSSEVDLSSQRSVLIARYNLGSSLHQSRSLTLREAIENGSFKQAEYNRAFVLMQYFGYLRRDADDGGYNFWLDVLNNRVSGNYRSMVCAFINSAEYQLRFSSVVTRNDQVCGNAGP